MQDQDGRAIAISTLFKRVCNPMVGDSGQVPSSLSKCKRTVEVSDTDFMPQISSILFGGKQVTDEGHLLSPTSDKERGRFTRDGEVKVYEPRTRVLGQKSKPHAACSML